MMGSQYRDNQSVAAMSRKEGSMYSGRASNFNRGKKNPVQPFSQQQQQKQNQINLSITNNYDNNNNNI
jgi:hypothetical protein